MTRAALVSTAIFLVAANAAAADRAAMMEETARIGFAKAEELRLAAASARDARATRELAEFYMANGLWVEALARLKDDATAAGKLLAAECELRMGRDRAAAARLADVAPNDAIAAIAWTRLGAYAEARAAFEAARAPEASRNLSDDHALAAAETFAATGDAGKAEAALSRLAEAKAHRAATAFLTGRIRAMRGDRTGAAAAFRRAAESGESAYAMRARLALAVDAGDVGAVDALSLEWRGGAFERDLRLALGRMRLADGDFDRGFAALGGVVDRFPQSQAALDAQDLISAALPELFADDAGLHPKEAARLFFENVAFAPPGREGDALIHEAAGRLEALGLYRQAAQLLDHQVFKRLRGEDRAIVAGDLAELLLQARDAAGALKVIRATRFAGLSEAANLRRRQIESRALAATGRSEEATALLADAPAASDLKLRADINWTRKSWPEAARDYASYVLSLATLAKKDDKAAAVRAATAYLLAGDRAGYRAFSQEAAQRLGDAAEADLIRSLGDVDRDRFLAKVMDDYRAVYGGGKS